MGALTQLEQPDFVEDIADSVTKLLKKSKRNEDLVVTRPDYAAPVDGRNLLRTSLHLQLKIEAKEGQAVMLEEGSNVAEHHARAVHISNIAQLDHLTKTNPHVAVVFENDLNTTKPTSVTRHYFSKELIAEQPIQVTSRDYAELPAHIRDFLINGTLPPMPAKLVA